MKNCCGETRRCVKCGMLWDRRMWLSEWFRAFCQDCGGELK